MTKQEFLASVANLYRVGNMADSDNPMRPDWVKPEMASDACCAALDTMLRELVKCKAITPDDLQALHDTL